MKIRLWPRSCSPWTLKSSRGAPPGRVYGESISIAVAAHIAARYAVSTQQPLTSTGGLARRRLSRILDFVLANLDSDLSVAELAALAHLSPSHFVQVFRQSVGMTPHQYVRRQRIAKAKRLLAEGHLSIAEVALAAGFANQSHFGETFRQLVGATPKRYQEQRGAPGASEDSDNIHPRFREAARRSCPTVEGAAGATLAPTRKK